MSCPIPVPDMGEEEVAAILSAPRVRRRLGDRLGADARVTVLDGLAYKVTGTKGDYVVRFPRDGAQLSRLVSEQGVQRGLRGRITALVPDTSVIDDLDGYPAFAIHRMIPGEPLTTSCYERCSRAARDRLVRDLVGFFGETHSVPLEEACEWVDVPFHGERTAAELASRQGKPVWFGPDAIAEMRPRLMPILSSEQAALFEDTVKRFGALETRPDYMVFGHGDMHGYNVAIGRDRAGLRLVGVFDLGCAGILDIHEDFFRLSLISEDLLETVIETYQSLPGQTRALERGRIATYYRAFLFYLMVGKSGEGLSHLKALLQRHLERCAVGCGQRGEAG